MAEQLARLLSANHPDMVLLDRLRDEYLVGSDSDSGHVSDDDTDSHQDSEPELQLMDKEVDRQLGILKEDTTIVFPEDRDRELQKCREFR